jgi:hypothetical protein
MDGKLRGNNIVEVHGKSEDIKRVNIVNRRTNNAMAKGKKRK